MKIKSCYGILAISILLIAPSYAQVTQLKEQVHYSLIESLSDSLGNVDDMERINAPFRGDEGIYAYGGYVFSNITPYDSSLIQTLNIPFLAADEFAVSVEFKLDTLDGWNHPILIQGSSYRHLGFGYQYNAVLASPEFYTFFNAASFEQKITVVPEKDKWYHLLYYHNRTQQKTIIYLDGLKVDSLQGAVEDNGSDYRISNTHFGNGLAYRGFMRHLRIFSSEISNSLRDLASLSLMQIYPNPVGAHQPLQILTDFTHAATLECYSMSGQRMHATKVPPGSQKVELPPIHQDNYIIKAGNEKEGYVSSVILQQ